MVDWSKAPEGAEYYGRAADWAFDTYFKFISDSLYWFKGGQWLLFSGPKSYDRSVQQVSQMQTRPDIAKPVWGKAHDVATHWGTIGQMTGFWEVNGDDIWFLDNEYGKLKYQIIGDKNQIISGLTPRPNRVVPDGIAQSVNNMQYVGAYDDGRATPPSQVIQEFCDQMKTSANAFRKLAEQLPTANKYDRTIHGKNGTGQCTVDVYRVLNAFGPLSPEIDHAVKKLLAPGNRGHKDERQDLLEAIQSIEARLQYLEVTNG